MPATGRQVVEFGEVSLSAPCLRHGFRYSGIKFCDSFVISFSLMDQGFAGKSSDRWRGYFGKAKQNSSQDFKILFRGTLVEYGDLV